MLNEGVFRGLSINIDAGQLPSKLCEAVMATTEEHKCTRDELGVAGYQCAAYEAIHGPKSDEWWITSAIKAPFRLAAGSPGAVARGTGRLLGSRYEGHLNLVLCLFINWVVLLQEMILLWEERNWGDAAHPVPMKQQMQLFLPVVKDLRKIPRGRGRFIEHRSLPDPEPLIV